jgi:hypothetical protein
MMLAGIIYHEKALLIIQTSIGSDEISIKIFEW